ncbi:MAG TPA: hypothetical protein H9711_05665 [Candidatus Mediterraneibacter intestinavium]|nr:hypothetical protein [Candidatus Mediterraneibacter intestinavium]
MNRKEAKRKINETIGMVKENNCREAAFLLGADTVRRAGSEEISHLIFELLPLKSRPAKEIMSRLLEYGRPEVAETDAKGNTLLKRVIRSERTDVLNGIVSKVRKRDIRKKGMEKDWTVTLRYLLDHQQKRSAERLLKLGILGITEEEAREELCRKILGYKDEKMLEAVIRCEGELPTCSLTVPESASEKQFMCVILTRYLKYINIEEDRERLWEIAVSCDADEIMRRMLKKKKDYQYLSRLAGGSDTAFRVLDCVRPADVLAEVRKETLISAFLSESGKQRFEHLKEKGWARGESRKETISILCEVREELERKRYGKSRHGQRERAADRNRLNYLIRCEAEETGKAV